MDSKQSREEKIRIGLLKLSWDEHDQLEEIAKAKNIVPEPLRSKMITLELLAKDSEHLEPDVCKALLGETDDL